LVYLNLPVDPATCKNDPDCSKCADDIMDFPDEIATILSPTPISPTAAPTTKCPPNLLSIGLNRQKLSTVQSGIQIEFLNQQTFAWTSVFALLDDEIAACGGCHNTLSVNGSVPANQVLITPGLYRIKQCSGYDNDPTQDLCDGAPGYNSTVTFSNPSKGVSASKPYGSLFADQQLVCSSTKYPGCPLNFQCCIWDKQTEYQAWSDCINGYPGGVNTYNKSCMN